MVFDVLICVDVCVNSATVVAVKELQTKSAPLQGKEAD